LELADSWKFGLDARTREKLIWSVGFGGISSGGRRERAWFISLFRDICNTLEVRSWEYVRVMFRNVLWRDELDDEGVRFWGEMQTIRSETM
jgi:hypothetical protein